MAVYTYKGRCLCGDTQYGIKAEPFGSHTCSCTMCQRWAGAPTVPWVSFKGSLEFTGKHKSLDYYQSSKDAKRGRCRTCGSPIEVLDDRCPGETCIVMNSLYPASLTRIPVPKEWHNASGKVPNWWHLEIGFANKGFVRNED